LLADLQRTVYPSAAGPVQTTETSESSPVRDRRSTTEPPNRVILAERKNLSRLHEAAEGVDFPKYDPDPVGVAGA